MAFRVRQVDDHFGIWSDYANEFVNPKWLCITGEQIRLYTEVHPYPDPYDYSLEDLILDVTESDASYIISTKNIKIAQYVAVMLWELS